MIENFKNRDSLIYNPIEFFAEARDYLYITRIQDIRPMYSLIFRQVRLLQELLCKFCHIFRTLSQYLLSKTLIHFWTTISGIISLNWWLVQNLSPPKSTCYHQQSSLSLILFLLRIFVQVIYVSPSSLWLHQYFSLKRRMALHSWYKITRL